MQNSKISWRDLPHAEARDTLKRSLPRASSCLECYLVFRCWFTFENIHTLSLGLSISSMGSGPIFACARKDRSWTIARLRLMPPRICRLCLFRPTLRGSPGSPTYRHHRQNEPALRNILKIKPCGGILGQSIELGEGWAGCEPATTTTHVFNAEAAPCLSQDPQPVWWRPRFLRLIVCTFPAGLWARSTMWAGVGQIEANP